MNLDPVQGSTELEDYAIIIMINKTATNIS